MNLRARLLEAVRDVQIREVVTFLYRDHPEGAAFAALHETLFLHQAFEESSLRRLVEDGVLKFDGTRYKISADARKILDRDVTILMDEF